jgi:hypothetical protein
MVSPHTDTKRWEEWKMCETQPTRVTARASQREPRLYEDKKTLFFPVLEIEEHAWRHRRVRHPFRTVILLE